MKNEPRFRVSQALAIVGAVGVSFGLLTVVGSTLLYASGHDFSFLSTYLSDVGNTPGWPGTVFNTGMLLVAPIRYLFLVLLVLLLGHYGMPSMSRCIALALGVVVALGSAGTAAIPFSLSRELHMLSAMLYFFGTVILQSLIAWQEWRARLPRLLPVLSLSVVASYLIFAVLLSLVGKVETVTRATPVIWEWLAFASLMFWLVGHSVVLGAKRMPPQGESRGEA